MCSRSAQITSRTVVLALFSSACWNIRPESGELPTDGLKPGGIRLGAAGAVSAEYHHEKPAAMMRGETCRPPPAKETRRLPKRGSRVSGGKPHAAARPQSPQRQVRQPDPDQSFWPCPRDVLPPASAEHKADLAHWPQSLCVIRTLPRRVPVPAGYAPGPARRRGWPEHTYHPVLRCDGPASRQADVCRPRVSCFSGRGRRRAGNRCLRVARALLLG